MFQAEASQMSMICIDLYDRFLRIVFRSCVSRVDSARGCNMMQFIRLYQGGFIFSMQWHEANFRDCSGLR